MKGAMRVVRRAAACQRQTVRLYEFSPTMNARSFVAPSATIVGEVFIGPAVHVSEGCVVRGDANAVLIEDTVFIGENTSISALPALYRTGEKAETVLDSESLIGPNCTLISCRLGKYCVVGANTVICEGAVVEQNVMIGPNSVVPPNRVLPEDTVWGGNPVRFIKALTKEDKAAVHDLRARATETYSLLCAEMLDNSAAAIWFAQESLAKPSSNGR